jgi:hypothetical protein
LSKKKKKKKKHVSFTYAMKVGDSGLMVGVLLEYQFEIDIRMIVDFKKRKSPF